MIKSDLNDFDWLSIVLPELFELFLHDFVEVDVQLRTHFNTFFVKLRYSRCCINEFLEVFFKDLWVDDLKVVTHAAFYFR